MKVVCDREALLAALQTVAGVVPSRTPKTVLQSIKASASEDIRLFGTDLEIGIQSRVQPTHVEEPGELLLPAARTIAILREMRDDEVTLTATASGTRIEGTRSHFELTTEDVADFPAVPELKGDRFHRIESEVLRALIRRTVFATDPENTRYALGGILTEMEGEEVRFVATDGRRLALMQATGEPVNGHSTEGITAVVPAKAMQLVERQLVGEKEPTLVTIEENRAIFATSRATVVTNLLQGRFPNYQAVIPKSRTGQLSVAAGEFARGIRQAAVVTTEESRGVTLGLGGDELKLVGSSRDIGRSEVYVTAAYDGPQMRIAFDPRFLLDMLKNLEDAVTVRMNVVDAESAACFETDDGYLYVVMPLTIEEEEEPVDEEVTEAEY